MPALAERKVPAEVEECELGSTRSVGGESNNNDSNNNDSNSTTNITRNITIVIILLMLTITITITAIIMRPQIITCDVSRIITITNGVTGERDGEHWQRGGG